MWLPGLYAHSAGGGVIDRAPTLTGAGLADAHAWAGEAYAVRTGCRRTTMEVYGA
jgi:hypothetical protein